MATRHKSISGDLVRMLGECSQNVPAWLQGMANLASQESVDLAAISLDATDSAGSADFGAQDFRKTAQKGTWGASQKLSFDGFEENAYSYGSIPASESLLDGTESGVIDAATAKEGTPESRDGSPKRGLPGERRRNDQIHCSYSQVVSCSSP